ncbi:stress protein, partial [Bacillus sp. OA1]|nr:stress protein [Bacillus sp. OA1]
VFEDGEFTNKGDGGWINWAFRGWFDRDGGHVKFYRP